MKLSRSPKYGIFAAAFLWMLICARSGHAQTQTQSQEAPPETEGDEVLSGAEGSFAFPVEDLYIRRHDSELREMLTGLTISPGLYVPLSSAAVGNEQSGVAAPASPAVRVNLRYQPVGYWFANVTLYHYLDTAKRNAWDPDFTYSFGYDDWHPYTFSLVYSNYSNNRFDPRPADPVSELSYGTISAGYKAPVPDALARPILIDRNLTINCRADLNFSPRFEREDGTIGTWKRNASLGCRYPITEWLYIDLTAYAWGHGQQPWDPDFTYGFGLFDYRSNRFSLQYSNYSGNRFPGRDPAKGTGRFRNGGVLLSWNHAF